MKASVTNRVGGRLNFVVKPWGERITDVTQAVMIFYETLKPKFALIVNVIIIDIVGKGKGGVTPTDAFMNAHGNSRKSGSSPRNWLKRQWRQHSAMLWCPR